MAWSPIGEHSHNGYTVITETVKSVDGRSVYGSEFSIPPKTDFWVICNYDATNLSDTAHVEMYYSDVPGGTFRARTKTSGYYFNATSAAIDNTTVTIPQDISTVKEYPRYKLRITGNGGGGNVKFVVFYSAGQEW